MYAMMMMMMRQQLIALLSILFSERERVGYTIDGKSAKKDTRKVSQDFSIWSLYARDLLSSQ
jgi:hypothetical protein